jgi:hypothetical protein
MTGSSDGLRVDRARRAPNETGNDETGKEVNLLAVHILGISIAGREILIIVGVVLVIVAIAGFLVQRRRPR